MKQAIISNNKISYVDYVPSEDFGLTPEQEIEQCKALLSATDYKAIKFAEGEISAEDYETIRIERRNLRARINELEKEL